MRSNCIIEALRIYRELRRADEPGATAWLCFRRSWERGVPFHMAAGQSNPYDDTITIVHFQPFEKKRKAWWPEWKFPGFLKRGDFPSTVIPKDDR